MRINNQHFKRPDLKTLKEPAQGFSTSRPAAVNPPHFLQMGALGVWTSRLLICSGWNRWGQR